MKALLAVARREVAEKKFVFAAAAVASGIPFVIPLVRGMSGIGARDVRDAVAVLLSASIAAAFALALGTTTLAADSASGRLGFYLSRPISTASLWAGKLAGALALVLGTAAVVLAPTLIVQRGLVGFRDLAGSTAKGLLLEAAACGLLLLIAHGIGTVTRSRSWLALLDLVFAIAVGAIGWLEARSLAPVWNNPDAFRRRAAAAWAVVLVIALLAAIHRGLSKGRLDPRATHRAFSPALWATLFAFTAIFTAYSQWVLSAPASEVRSLQSASALGPNGWISLTGTARGAWGSFLYDTRTGRSERLHDSWPTVSADGRLAAWISAADDSEEGPAGLKTLRLDSPGSRPSETRVAFPHRPEEFFLSGDGSRVGAIADGILKVFDIASGRCVGAARVAGARGFANGDFVDRDLVRIGRVPDRAQKTLEILEYDISRGTLVQTGTASSIRAWYMASPSHGSWVSCDDSRSRITLQDGRSGAVIATLRDGSPLKWSSVRFLQDGRFILLLGDETGSWAEVFSRSGRFAARIPIGPSGRLRIGGEISAGRIAVAVSLDRPGASHVATLDVLDADKGTREEAAKDLWPIWQGWNRTIPAGSEATKLYLTRDGSLIRLDPESRARRRILGGAEPLTP